MKEDKKHTPLPYRMDIEPDTGLFKVFTVQDDDYTLVADGLTQANAEFIVRACNSPYNSLSDDAKSTLVGMVEFCVNQGYCMGMDEGRNKKGKANPDVKELIKFCEAENEAIAKAEGK